MEIRDEASRFNINNLYHDGAVELAALAIFQRLLTQLNLKPDIAIAALDWQDADNEVYNDGGNEGTVCGQQGASSLNPTLPNQPFFSIAQLQEVRGMSAEALASLRPYITAVPYYLPLNVNTASPEILAALVDGVSAQQLQGLINLREQQVVESIDSLWQQPPLNALSAEQRQLLTSLLAVDSRAFTAKDNANLGTALQRFATVLISKIEAVDSNTAQGNNNANNAATNGSNSNIASDNNDNKPAKTVRVVSQRLWAFQPNF